MQSNEHDASFRAYFERWSESFQNDLLGQQKRIFNGFLEMWGELCRDVVVSGRSVAYVEISLLRSDYYADGVARVIMEAFDENWIFGSPVSVVDAQMPILSEIFRCHRESILQEARKYIGKIPAYTVKKEMLEELPKIDKTLAMILEMNSEELCSHIAFENSPFEELVQLSLGEYRRFQYEINLSDPKSDNPKKGSEQSQIIS